MIINVRRHSVRPLACLDFVILTTVASLFIYDMFAMQESSIAAGGQLRSFQHV